MTAVVFLLLSLLPVVFFLIFSSVFFLLLIRIVGVSSLLGWWPSSLWSVFSFNSRDSEFVLESQLEENAIYQEFPFIPDKCFHL